MQIKQYSYSPNGSIPQSWSENEQGLVNGYVPLRYDRPLKFMDLPIGASQYKWLCIVEYATVSLSLSLAIAKFFPAIHNQIVSKVTRMEHQSLYWGTVIVSNILTFGLLFLAGRAWSITKVISIFMYRRAVFPLIILEVVFNTILFVGALVASCSGHGGTGVPIPNGISKIFIYVSFLFSCFCCCACCSVHCKRKALRVLVLFSFMSSIYYSILNIISAIFLLFIEETRISVVTLTFIYISLLVFLVLFTSLTLFQSNVSGWFQCLNCFGDTFFFISVFSALMLLIAIYIIIVFSLKLQGVSGIVTGLIPSIILSSISWYIKKRLLTKGHTTSSSSSDRSELQTEPGTSDGAENDKLEDDD